MFCRDKWPRSCLFKSVWNCAESSTKVTNSAIEILVHHLFDGAPVGVPRDSCSIVQTSGPKTALHSFSSRFLSHGCENRNKCNSCLQWTIFVMFGDSRSSDSTTSTSYNGKEKRRQRRTEERFLLQISRRYFSTKGTKLEVDIPRAPTWVDLESTRVFNFGKAGLWQGG